VAEIGGPGVKTPNVQWWFENIFWRDRQMEQKRSPMFCNWLMWHGNFCMLGKFWWEGGTWIQVCSNQEQLFLGQTGLGASNSNYSKNVETETKQNY
jgi:hypothetical protein